MTESLEEKIDRVSTQWEQLDAEASYRNWHVKYYRLVFEVAGMFSQYVMSEAVMEMALSSPFITFSDRIDDQTILTKEVLVVLFEIDRLLKDKTLHYIDQIRSSEDDDYVGPCLQLYFTTDPLVAQRYSEAKDLHYERSCGGGKYIASKLFVLGRFIEEAPDLYELMGTSG